MRRLRSEEAGALATMHTNSGSVCSVMGHPPDSPRRAPIQIPARCHKQSTKTLVFEARSWLIASSISSAASMYHINITRSTESEAAELPIIGFNIEIYHHYDAEVGGPLKGPSNDTSKKRRCCSIETSSSEKLQNVSVLSQSSRLVSLQDKTTEDPATIPYSHHVATERVEEFTPFCAAASSK